MPSLLFYILSGYFALGIGAWLYCNKVEVLNYSSEITIEFAFLILALVLWPPAILLWWQHRRSAKRSV